MRQVSFVKRGRGGNPDKERRKAPPLDYSRRGGIVTMFPKNGGFSWG